MFATYVLTSCNWDIHRSSWAGCFPQAFDCGFRAVDLAYLFIAPPTSEDRLPDEQCDVEVVGCVSRSGNESIVSVYVCNKRVGHDYKSKSIQWYN